MAGAGPGQRGGAGLAFEHLRVHGIGGHHRLPLGPFAVADGNGDRTTRSFAVPDAADDSDGVGLELHPSTSPEAEPAPSESVGQILAGDANMRRQPLQNRHQGGAVRLARRQPSQHEASLSREHRPPRAVPDEKRGFTSARLGHSRT
jgi:hypothetical protein